jgi:hypothetical protein
MLHCMVTDDWLQSNIAAVGLGGSRLESAWIMSKHVMDSLCQETLSTGTLIACGHSFPQVKIASWISLDLNLWFGITLPNA